MGVSRNLQTNMIIPKEKLEEFKKLYREHYGIDLNDSETLDKATRLVRLIKAVLRGSHPFISVKDGWRRK